MEKNKQVPEPLDLWKRYVFHDIKDRARLCEARTLGAGHSLSPTHEDITALISMVERLLKQVEATK